MISLRQLSSTAARFALVLALILAVNGLVFLSNPSVSQVEASTTANITITATGSEVDISCNQTIWAIGTVQATQTYATTITWGLVTNDGSEDVDVAISGDNMTGGAVVWVLSDDGNAGAGIIGMNAGLDDADDLYDIVIKRNTTFNLLVDELTGSGGTEAFGLQFKSPTSGVGNEAMTMINGGVWLTGSID